MCWTCFLLYTDQPIINDRVQAAHDAIAASGTTRADRAASFLLHVIFADMNVDDWYFEHVQADQGLHYLYEQAQPWERALFDLLAPLSEPERATVIAIDWGYLDRDGTLRPDIIQRTADRLNGAPTRRPHPRWAIAD